MYDADRDLDREFAEAMEEFYCRPEPESGGAWTDEEIGALLPVPF